MRIALVVVAGALLVPAGAQAAGSKVTWPEQRDYQYGERATVKVASPTPVRVALVRETIAGKVMKVVARKTLRNGTFNARFGNPGRYALLVGDTKRRYTVTPVCTREDGDRAELRLAASTARAGGTLSYEVVNTSTVGCVLSGLGNGFERRLPDGAWELVPLNRGVNLIGVMIGQWTSYAKTAEIPADFASGRYRIVDHFGSRKRGELTRNVKLTAEFDVVP